MAQFHGYEVCTEGDAFLVAFHTPEDACAWCVAVQQVRHGCLSLIVMRMRQTLLLTASPCKATMSSLSLCSCLNDMNCLCAPDSPIPSVKFLAGTADIQVAYTAAVP